MKTFNHLYSATSGKLNNVNNTFNSMKISEQFVSIFYISNLIELEVRGNSLQVLPDVTTSASTLGKLDVSYNNINYISRDILATLSRMRYIDLSFNPIMNLEEFPIESMPVLCRITLTYVFIIDFNHTMYIILHKCMAKG